MSEAIISRRGYDANGKPELRTEIITGTTNWTVPNSIRNTTISVRIFGGRGYFSDGKNQSSNCPGGGGILQLLYRRGGQGTGSYGSGWSYTNAAVGGACILEYWI